MKTSEQINELAAALAKAQGVREPAIFDKINPHFKSKYASINSIMDSVKKPLADNGLSTIQSLAGNGDALFIITRVLHSSGQWIEDDGVPLLLDKQNMQGLGSAISYAKRYGISAMLSIVCDEDDDGTGATAGTLPEVKSVTYSGATQTPRDVTPANGIPQCCGKAMSVSKYIVKEFGDTPPWYCFTCKNKQTRAVA